MKISYKWLQELCPTNWSPDELGDRLTLCGTACEYVDPADEFMQNVIVGEIKEINKIEGADKIRLATVFLGEETMEVVCGAPNIEVGQKVPVAMLGAKLAGGIIIKKAKIRGIESKAMICSERELGLSEDHSGILVLDSDAKPGEDIAELLGFKGDYKMTFELTPNRPDSMSAIGIARDIAALTSQVVAKPKFELKETGEKASDYITVKIDDPELCPRYAARMVKNVKIGESPWWIKEKLIQSGVRPISNVVDITNLAMLETGQPFHAFDYDRFGSKEVVVRKAKDKEKFKTLDSVEHELIPDVLLITNGKEGVAAGGVMGGLNSEVEDDTVNVLLEAAYFDPSMIRKSRKHLGFVTESSQRFEKGCDPNNVEYAVDRCAYLLQEICGGEVLEGIVDSYPNKIEPKTIKFRVKRCNDLLGHTVEPKRIKQIFSDLEFSYTGDDDVLEVTVPTFRPDIEREVDLIEEVVRIIGFDAIPDAVENKGALYTPIHYRDRFKKELRDVLTGAGFDEIISHGLVDSRQSKALFPEKGLLKIVNPVSEDIDVMRNSLMPTMLSVVSHNIKQRAVDLALFEIGTYYLPPDEKENWVEKDNICIAVTGETPANWREKAREYDFYDISGALNSMASHFGFDKLKYKPNTKSFFEEQLSYDILIEDKVIGLIGRLKAQIAKKFDIKQTVYVAELDAEYIMSESGKLKTFNDLPIYPAAPRDLAIVVNRTVQAADIVALIKKTAGKIAESVDIFDVYTGKQIAEDKKSIAVAINYRSTEKSLESSQVDAVQGDVVAALKKKFNAEIRDK